MPNRMMPELTAPMMKNFAAASVACLSFLRNATRAKVLRLDVSNARKRTKRSVAPGPAAHHAEWHEDRDAGADRRQRPERVGPFPPREAEDRGRERGRHKDRLREEHPVARHVRGLPESPAPSSR